MSDNVTATPGTGGEIFASDDIGGIQYPRTKVTWGPDGTANDTDIAAGKALPVQLRKADGTVSECCAHRDDPRGAAMRARLRQTLVSVALLLTARSAFATTYYIDSSITDTNVASATPDCTNYDPVAFVCSGGSASAYKTIADVNLKSFAAGDSVLFRKGQTWRETLVPPSSGSAGSVITFGAFGSGADPIVSGASLFTGWASVAPTVEDFTDGTGPKPVAWWMFEDASATALDGNTTNHNDLTWPSNGARDTTHVQGTYALSTPTNADNAHRAFASLSSTFPCKTGTLEMTVGGWIYLKGNASTFTEIAACGNESTTGWYIEVSGTTGILRGSVFSSGGAKRGTANAAITSDGWHHVVLRWNGENRASSGANDEVSIWMDGVKQTSTGTATDMTAATTGNFFIQGSTTGVIRADEWFAFSQAITDTQIAAIYSYGLAGERAQATTYSVSAATQPRVLFVNDVQAALGSSASTLSNGQWFWVSNLLYYRSDAGNPDTLTLSMDAGQRRNMSVAGRTYLAFAGLTFQRSNDASAGVYISGTTGALMFSACTVKDGAGIGIQVNTSASVTVSGCSITNNALAGIEIDVEGANLIENNTISGNGTSTSSTSGIGFLLGGSIIRNNDIYGNGAGGSYPLCHGIYADGAGVGTATIYGNKLHDHTKGGGLRLNGSVNAYDNVIYNNTGAGVPIYVSDSATGYVWTLSRNLIYGNGSTGVIVSHLVNATQALNLYNNTLYGNTGATLLVDDGENPILTLKNNLFFVPAATLAVNLGSGTITTKVIDYNLYWRADASASLFNYNGGFQAWAAWKALGFDAHGLNADPLLTNVGASDFSLQSTSPARDAGLNLGTTYQLGLSSTTTWPSGVATLNQNQNGSRWEIGAYVYRQAGINAPIWSAPVLSAPVWTSPSVR